MSETATEIIEMTADTAPVTVPPRAPRRPVATGPAVEKHAQRIFAWLGLLPDGADHRRVEAVPAYVRSPG